MNNPQALRTIARAVICCAAACPASQAWSAYKCVDERGKSRYQDTPPAECANVVIYEVTSSGKLVRRIEPHSSTPAASAPPKEADRASLDRARHDSTLLDSYSNEREIDAARDRSLQPLSGRVSDAETKLEQLRARRKQAADAKRGTPASKAEQERLQAEEASAEKSLAAYRAERQRVADQFEKDKQRWKELKGGAR